MGVLRRSLGRSLGRTLAGSLGWGTAAVGLAVIVLGVALSFRGTPAYSVDPSIPRASLRPVARMPAAKAPPCPSCTVLQSWGARLEAARMAAAARYGQAADQLATAADARRGPADIRARRDMLMAVLVRAEEDGLAADALKQAFEQARRDCGFSPFCAASGPRPSRRFQVGCPREMRPLTEESVWVRRLAGLIAEVTGACLAQACPGLACDAAVELDTRLRDVEEGLANLMAMPLKADDAGAAFRRSPLGAETRRLVRSTLRLPVAVPALFQPEGANRGGLAGTEITGLAEEIARLGQWADDLAGRVDLVAGLETGDGTGIWRVRLLSTRLWRLYDTSRAIALARTETPVDRSAALHAAWGQFGNTLSALALDALRLEGELERPPEDDRNAQIDACRAYQAAPHRTMTRYLVIARSRLSRCMARAACPTGGPALKAVDGRSAVTSWMDMLSALDNDLGIAARAVSQVAVTDHPPGRLETDRLRYMPGETMTVSWDLRQPVCMAEPGASAALLGPGAAPEGLETREAARPRLERRLEIVPSAPGSRVIEAPLEPGTYAVKAFAPDARGGVETAAIAFNVLPPPTRCDGFSGTWETDFGILRLTVRDGEARGTYRRARATRAGFLTGTVKGSVLTGEWRSELGRGGTRLVLADSGGAFAGSWGNEPGELGGTGSWNGQCVSGS